MQYDFEWDPIKARQNIRNHKISFQRAAAIFLDPHMTSLYDEEHSEQEERWVTMGIDENGILLVVSHTFHEVDHDSCMIRIISARKATKKERRQYEEG